MNQEQKQYRYELIHGQSIRFVIFEKDDKDDKDDKKVYSRHGYVDYDDAEAAAIRWIDMNS